VVEEIEEDSEDPYEVVLRIEAARKADKRIVEVHEWHEMLERPANLSEAKYATFLRYCIEFFIAANKLWRKDHKGEHKLVVLQSRRLFVLAAANNDVGHHGYFATNALISQRYWWSFMSNDIQWFIKTCRLCQLRKTQNVLIAPVVATPAPLFAKIYIDTMHLPPSSGYKYMVQGRCSLTHWAEFDMLRKENTKSIGEWLLKCFIY